MRFLFDTDICIYLIKERSDRLLRKIQEYSPTELAISSITFAELDYGVHKSKRPEQNAAALFKFVTSIQVLPFDADAAQEYGLVRAFFEKKGKLIGSIDLLIAAHALALKCTLVTNNEKEFSRVPGLRIENWAEKV